MGTDLSVDIHVASALHHQALPVKFEKPKICQNGFRY